MSELGKVLDPVADRLLFLVGAGGILIDGSVPAWFAVIVLVRETLVGGATLVLAALGARRIDVTWFGKAGTFGLMIAFPLFLASHSDLSWADTAGVLAWIAGIPAWRSASARPCSTYRSPGARSGKVGRCRRVRERQKVPGMLRLAPLVVNKRDGHFLRRGPAYAGRDEGRDHGRR